LENAISNPFAPLVAGKATSSTNWDKTFIT